jgi:hypothetical protein
VRRTIYLLTVRAEPGVAEIRALRAWLKIGLRTFGLRCVGITPKDKEKAMDARKYASRYVRPDNLRDGPIQTRIVNVFEEERYGRLTLELETGSQFALNDGNTNTLIKAWGHDTDGWIGLELALELGTYKDWRDDPPSEKETVRVRRRRSVRRTAVRLRANRCRQAGRRRRSRSKTISQTTFHFDDALPWPILVRARDGSHNCFACWAPAVASARRRA